MFVWDNRLQGHSELPLNPTFDQAQKFFNFRIDESLGWSKTKQGESCWKIVGIEINTGILVYRPVVWMENGKPSDKDRYLIYRYNGASPVPNPLPNPLYFSNAHSGFTELGGDKKGRVEFDTHVMQDGNGPDSIWVSASPNGLPPQHSDMMTNLGWRGDTNHDAVSPLFQWSTKGSEPMDKKFYLELRDENDKFLGRLVFISEQEPKDGYYMVLLNENGQEAGRIYFN